MYGRNWLTLTGNRLSDAARSGAAGMIALGGFLGIVAVSMWQQWTLTFGQDPDLLLATMVVLALALACGRRWQQRKTADGRALTTAVWCLAAWSLLHPFWIDALTTFVQYLPSTYLEDRFTKTLVTAAIATLGWLIPGMLWSAVLVQGSTTSSADVARSQPRALPLILIGVCCGLIFDSLCFAPWIGMFSPTAIASVLACAVSWCYRCHDAKPTEMSTSAETFASTAGIAPFMMRILIAGGVGGLLACNLRLANQLLPHGGFVVFIEASGVLLGFAAGLIWLRRQPAQVAWASWAGLVAAASSSLLLAAQPWLVNLSLWLNSMLTSVAGLLAARSILLISAAFPFGLALSWLSVVRRDEPIPSTASATFFIAGLGVAAFLLSGSVGLIPLMTTCAGILLLLSAIDRIRLTGFQASRPVAAGLTCLVLASLSLPLWNFCDNPSRTAKLLFSTPTFLAYRSGWEIQHLPYLDDSRMIERREGNVGPLTLWRGRVAELYLREAGLPRAVVTKSSDAVPQFAPEVLQAVYSLVICDQPGRVLFLGLSAGVPLSTSLNFPIREAVCIEGDANLISMIRGPLARETGFDPLSDDRVTLRQINPELALMSQPTEPFDVVLSNPLSSATAEGAASFTREFYQRAARQLAERGVFCQRFECVDYGPEPLRMVLQAMRTAFRNVMAIETSAGELLLMASQAENVFVPDDLAARLETKHVCKVLARSGLDWSTLLNQPAYDHAALGEVCEESRAGANSTLHGQLASQAPMEVMRWANKLQEVQATLTATRVSPASFWNDPEKKQANWLENEIHLSRRSRLVEWLGDRRVSQELLRRLGEVVSQRKTVHENPDTHWWAYRKTLRKQLQDRPRTAIQQVKAINEKASLHPEDERRRDYFSALGAAHRESPTRDQVAAVERFLDPYDPLLSYFAHHEVADLLAKGGEDPGLELAYRLHVIYFAPTLDGSVWNVAKALETLVKHPEAIPNESIRYDALNGLIQTLRVRWEIRQSSVEPTSNLTLDYLDQSLLAVEKGVAAMDAIAGPAGVPDADWQTRKEVINRLMIRPLTSFRTEIRTRKTRSRAQSKALIDSIGEAQIDEAAVENNEETR